MKVKVFIFKGKTSGKIETDITDFLKILDKEELVKIHFIKQSESWDPSTYESNITVSIYYEVMEEG